MKFVLYFMGNAFGLYKTRTKECICLAEKVRDTYNCNVELVCYRPKRVRVWSFKKQESSYPYSKERLERNGMLF